MRLTIIIITPATSPPYTIPSEKGVGEALVLKCMDESGANKNTNNVDEEVPAKI